MIAAAPRPVPRPDVALTLGGTEVDLRTRALVAGVVPPPRFARESEVLAAVAAVRDAGVDLADVSLAPRLVGAAARQGGVPVAVLVRTPEDAGAALAAGAAVVLVAPSAAPAVVPAVAASHPSQVAVIVDDLAALAGAIEMAGELGVAVGVDSTRWPRADALAGEPLAIASGCRIVRTADVRRSRRVVEVIAALLEARRG
ncbi:MAG TPA: hypothetical protein VFZ68_12430 [Acidimicrobiales bacterium]